MDAVDTGIKTVVAKLDEVCAQDSDVALVERIKLGDMGAFDILTKKYRERLFNVVYNIVANREDAMDIVQDSFIKAFSNIKSFKGDSAFYTWIYRISVNISISFIKKNRLKRFFCFENINEEISGAEILEKLGDNSGGQRTAILNELKEKLNESLQRLSIEHRTVVVLHEVEGLSHAEIAEITGTREATVRSRLHYAKQQLKVMLKDYVQ